MKKKNEKKNEMDVYRRRMNGTPIPINCGAKINWLVDSEIASSDK
jgi:hypothetical protein